MKSSLPPYGDLMLPVLKAVLELGGSGASREITESVIEAQGFSDELLAVTYEGREKSILIDRLDWARSYCKLGGVLESPKRGLFLITDLGREIAGLSESEANDRLKEVDHAVRSARRKKPKSPSSRPTAARFQVVESRIPARAIPSTCKRMSAPTTSPSESTRRRCSTRVAPSTGVSA